jgi:hypothetical protein
MSLTSDVELKIQTNQPIANDELFEAGKHKKARFRTYKNLLALSIAFLLQFTAFNGIQNLQSSLNTEANIGVNSSSIIYVFLIISSILLPHSLMSLLGLKWTLVISQVP